MYVQLNSKLTRQTSNKQEWERERGCERERLGEREREKEDETSSGLAKFITDTEPFWNWQIKSPERGIQTDLKPWKNGKRLLAQVKLFVVDVKQGACLCPRVMRSRGLSERPKRVSLNEGLKVFGSPGVAEENCVLRVCVSLSCGCRAFGFVQRARRVWMSL